MDTIGSNHQPIETRRDDYTVQTSNLILFVFQMLIILVVVSMSIYNLTFQRGDTSMWTALLSSSIGYVLPNPKLKFNENKK